MTRIQTIQALSAAAAIGAVSVAHAGNISWVQWSDGGTTGSGASTRYNISGTDATSGLAVGGSFTRKGNGNWYQNTANITDTDWNYANKTVTFWQTYNSATGFSSAATFTFTNTGGLAAGGSLAILDLERTGNSIGVTGYQWNGSSYSQVAVNWAFSQFTINVASAQPLWDAATNTLSGNALTYPGGIDNFAMLTSNVRLDRIDLSINLPYADGIGIGFTQANIAADTVPAPGVLGMLGAAGVFRSRRRKA